MEFPGRDGDERSVLPSERETTTGRSLQPEIVAILPQKLLSLAMGVMAESHTHESRILHMLTPLLTALMPLRPLLPFTRHYILNLSCKVVALHVQPVLTIASHGGVQCVEERAVEVERVNELGSELHTI